MKKNTLILILVGLVMLCAGITIGVNISIRNSNINKESNEINNSIDDTNKKQGTNAIKEKIENSNNESNVSNEENTNSNSTSVPTLDTTINHTDEPKATEPKVEPKNEPVVSYSSNDTKVIDALEEAYNNIKNSEVTEEFKVNAKATFINIVDFLFYDGTIKGVTFSELTDSGKTKVLELANKIDDAIEKKVPNYKETIAAGATKAYKACSALIKKGASNLNSFLQSKLSEENYNSIIESKDDLVYYTKNAVSFLKDTGSKLFSSAKEKLSDWYNKYKNR